LIPQLIEVNADASRICDLSIRWQVAPELAVKLFLLAASLPFSLSIISGYRSPEHQEKLRRDPSSGAAPVHLSTHTSCPATGADVRVNGIAVDDQVKLTIGRAAERLGLRWGGGASRVNGIPIGNEWAHVDMGPRRG
jgi:uncharacterized protein YcbK (DUF882 family)